MDASVRLFFVLLLGSLLAQQIERNDCLIPQPTVCDEAAGFDDEANIDDVSVRTLTFSHCPLLVLQSELICRSCYLQLTRPAGEL